MALLMRVIGFASIVASLLHILVLPAKYLEAAPVDGWVLFEAICGQILILLLALSLAFPHAKWRPRIG